MEQYQLPRRKDFKELRLCLDNYETDSIFIRLKGSSGGTVKVSEDLQNKVLDFKKDESGLYLLIDSKEIFHFPLKGYFGEFSKGFSLAYERIRKEGKYDALVMLSTGEDPYDPKLPEPRRSFLRNILDDHLIEIYFKGRIDLEFHSWWNKPYWKYWKVVKPKK